MEPSDFEAVLDKAAEILTSNLRASDTYHDQHVFEQHVRDMIRVAADGMGVTVSPSFHPHAFPDITVNGYGVEVKYTKKDTWLAVGNSIFEGMRDHDVRNVYILFGKAGGEPEARWSKYEDCITHVRVSHAPRFVVQMEQDAPKLFDSLEVSYDEFWPLEAHEKMRHIRDYARGRLREGERLWWLDETEAHALPLQVRLYTRLSDSEKRMFRAEAAILSPKVCGSRWTRGGKYIDVALYLLTQHGVFCPQARDLFSAGSVALKSDPRRGGNYILRALLDIEDLMRDAAKRLEAPLFVEYWGADIPPDERLVEWLRRADGYAKDWVPSDHLFLPEQGP